jgi:hypothetical protein
MGECPEASHLHVELLWRKMEWVHKESERAKEEARADRGERENGQRSNPTQERGRIVTETSFVQYRRPAHLHVACSQNRQWVGSRATPACCVLRILLFSNLSTTEFALSSCGSSCSGCIKVDLHDLQAG